MEPAQASDLFEIESSAGTSNGDEPESKTEDDLKSEQDCSYIDSETQTPQPVENRHAGPDPCKKVLASLMVEEEENVCSICLDEFDQSEDPDVLTSCGYAVQLCLRSLAAVALAHLSHMAKPWATFTLQAQLPPTMYYAVGSAEQGVSFVL